MKRFSIVYLILPVFVVLFAGVLSSCAKSGLDGPENPDGPDIPEPSKAEITSAPTLPVTVAPPEFADYIESIVWSSDSTEQTITLNGEIPGDLIPSAGSILVLDQCERFPFGFGATIISIKRGQSVVLDCMTPNLSQFAESFDLSTDDNTLTAELFDVTDSDGNPIEYEEISPETDLGSRATFEHHVNNKILSLPFDIEVSNSTAWDNLRFSGKVYCGFRHLGVKLTKERGQRMTASFNIEPVAGFSAQSTVTGKVEAKKEVRIGQIRFTVKGTIAGVPVILPVTFYVYFVAEATGKISCTLELSSEYNASYTVSNESGHWASVKNGDKNSNEKPWAISHIDLEGSISGGIKGGVMVGIYSATVGVGLNFTPKYTLSASASLSSTDLYKINPLVESKAEIETEIYCAARLFGADLGKYSYNFPAIELFRRTMHLFPGISDFKARCPEDKASATVTYKREKRFFLEGLDSEEGIVLMDKDKTPLSYHQTTSRGEDDDKISKEYYFSWLSPRRKYYVAPYYKIFGKTFIGNEYEMRTGDEKETGHYRLTIEPCSYPTELWPEAKSFDLTITVNSENHIEDIKVEGADFDREYSWVLADERRDTDEKIYFTQTYRTLEVLVGNVDCINKSHSHNADFYDCINVNVWYHDYYYYVDRNAYESGIYRRMYYRWIRHMANFVFTVDGGIVTPCNGLWDVDWADRVLTSKIYDISARLERVD